MNRIEIFTERLALKPLGIEHFQTVKNYAMDYENTKYMRRLPFETDEEALSFLESAEAEWKKSRPAIMNLRFFIITNISARSAFILKTMSESLADFKQEILGKRICIRSREIACRIFCGKRNKAFFRPL